MSRNTLEMALVIAQAAVQILCICAANLRANPSYRRLAAVSLGWSAGTIGALVWL